MQNRNIKNSLLFCLCILVTCKSLAVENNLFFYGLLDIYASLAKPVGKAAEDHVMVIDSNGMTTSFIGVKKTVPLEHQMTAIGVLEGFLRPDNGEQGRFKGDNYFTRNAYVGLQTPIAEITIGRNTTPYFLSVTKTNPFGGSFGFSPSIKHSFLNGLQGDSSWGNSIQVSSTEIRGLKGSLLYATGETEGRIEDNRIGVSLFFKRDHISATLGFQQVDSITEKVAASRKDNQMASLAGLAYNIKDVELFVQFQLMQTKIDDQKTDRKMVSVGTSITHQKAKILFAMANTSNSDSASQWRETFSAGYDYFFNKQVDLYTVGFMDAIHKQGRKIVFAIGSRFRF